MRVSKIYVDMDGVLCDFEKRYKELYGAIDDKARRTTFRPNFKQLPREKLANFILVSKEQ